MKNTVNILIFTQKVSHLAFNADQSIILNLLKKIDMLFFQCQPNKWKCSRPGYWLQKRWYTHKSLNKFTSKIYVKRLYDTIHTENSLEAKEEHLDVINLDDDHRIPSETFKVKKLKKLLF